jgi:hypothetical protein
MLTILVHRITYSVLLGFSELRFLDAQSVSFAAASLVRVLRFDLARKDGERSVRLRITALVLIGGARCNGQLDGHRPPG